MKIRIVSDSTCDLPQKLLEKFGISIVPCFINFGDESFLDKIQISRVDFYQRISKSKEFPKTAAPGVGLFTEVYDRLADEGAQEIISIHIRTGPSNMSNVARLAAQTFDRVRVHVVEVGQVAITLGYLVVQAAKSVAEGKSIEDVVAAFIKQVELVLLWRSKKTKQRALTGFQWEGEITSSVEH